MPFREMNRDQAWLLPPTLDELIPPDHPARFVAAFVDELDRADWTELGVQLDGEPLGAPAYHPRALLSVWLYGFMTGVRSCRKLETACRDQIPYLWLTGWQHPDHNTLWRFYKAHRKAMRSLFERTVRTAVAMELVDLAVQAVDGTKVEANASLYRSYDEDGLRRLLSGVEAAIAELESQNEGGAEVPTAHLPRELSEKKVLRERVRRAMKVLSVEDRRSRVNLTDKEARLMKTRRGIVPAYNAQAMVSPVEGAGEERGLLITAVDVVDEPSDNALLAPMMKQAEETTGIKAEMTLADAGYHSGSSLEESYHRGQRLVMPEARRRTLERPYHKDMFIYDEGSGGYRCPEGQILRLAGTRKSRQSKEAIRLYRASGPVCRPCPAFGVCTTSGQNGRRIEITPHDSLLRRHRAWMRSRQARQAYRRRIHMIEPVFGIVKEQQSARRFLLRGVANVAAEWSLLATAFNLRTLWRIWRIRARVHSSPYVQAASPKAQCLA